MSKIYKVLIWGTGNIARHLLENGLNGQIIGYIETNKTKEFFGQKRIYDIEEMPEDYDFIIIANTYASEIYHICIERKLDLDKIIFLKSIKIHKGFSELKSIRKILGEKNYIDYCNEFNVSENSFADDDAKIYEKLNVRDSFRIQKNYKWIVLTDKYALAGNMSNYFWQDLWAARLIHKSAIKKHFDIGSRIDGFIAHLLSMEIEVTLIDIRKAPAIVENLHTIVDDATQLTQIPDNSIESMSALCSLEHFGLGRYGDPIDPEACFKCFQEIQKKIKRGGSLYISVPIGSERIEFNAHRVFYASTIIENFEYMDLQEFSCTADGKIEYNVEIHKYDQDKHHGDYRYGLFHFIKIGSCCDKI